MAYTGIDKEIYDSGTHFRPLQEYTQQQWTPPEIMGQNTNAGITNTQAAGSYMGYPSYEAWLLAQGGGGGGDGGGGRDDIITNPYNPNQNLGPTNITDYEAEAGDVGPTWAGSWAKFKDEYSKLPTPTNLAIRGWKGIQRWRENKKIEKAEKIKAAEISSAAMSDAQKEGAPTGGGYQGPRTYDFDRGDFQRSGGQRPDKPGGHTDPGRGSYGPHKAQGGRIGYRNGEFVDEDINIQGPGFDVNENIEMAEEDPFRMRIQELMSKGLSWEDAYDIAAQEFQDDFAEGPEESFNQEGIASIV